MPLVPETYTQRNELGSLPPLRDNRFLLTRRNAFWVCKDPHCLIEIRWLCGSGMQFVLPFVTDFGIELRSGLWVRESTSLLEEEKIRKT